MTLTEVLSVEGGLGEFSVSLKRHPRYVDPDKCIDCGACAKECPVSVPDEYNQGLSRRSAIFLRHPQAVPMKFQIDPKTCIRLGGGRCGICAEICPARAIHFDDKPAERTLTVGSVIMTPGLRPFDPSGIATWGYGTLPNVITSLELERMLSAAGPTEGQILRPSDDRLAKRIAFLQCVGSRDLNKAGHGYCSAVCCMSALKEATAALEEDPSREVFIFFMDMRTHGKDFERYYNRAKDAGVRFNRCRVHTLEPSDETGSVLVRYITDQGKQVETDFDMVVLSVGMECPPSAVELAERAAVKLAKTGFAERGCFSPVQAKGRPGVFVGGAFAGPHDIPQSVTEASAAAAAAAQPLAGARHSLTKERSFPPERDVSGEDPRVGVFVCHCGSNIAGVIDVKHLAEYAATLPMVTHVERGMFSCSPGSQEAMKEAIIEKGLNRVVVAACTPRSHEPLFKETLKAAGLSDCLLEMANIRNHSSWVHSGEPEAATETAMDLVRMAVAKTGLLSAQKPLSVPVVQSALVVGGGVAGMVSALSLADQGFPVHLVEKAPRLGGAALHLFKTSRNEPVQGRLDSLVRKATRHELITVHLGSTVTAAEGYVGDFSSTLDTPSGPLTIKHGVVIVASGGEPYKPVEYAYGSSRRVLTALEFDKLHLLGDSRIKNAKRFVFIQCVGSREPERPYCSRVCCTHSVQAAIELKGEDPEREVFILYRDIRTYGQREELYRRARELGVVFINYEMHEKPEVDVNQDGTLDLMVWDHVLHQPFSMRPDMVILATAIVPSLASSQLAAIYKLPRNEDGFFQEAHAKLRPVDFAADGMFLAGLAHYPKPIEETVTQAQAAAARAATVLSKRSILLDTVKAHVIDERCDGCALCLDACPYHAITLVPVPGEEEKKLARVEAAMCKGCGCCQATCPKYGISVAGFTFEQLASQVDAALVPREAADAL